MPTTSEYFEQSVYNHIFRDTTFSKPTVSIALTHNIPKADGSFDEISGAGYLRYPKTIDYEAWTNWMTMGAEGSGTNAVTLYFGKATSDWGAISGVVVVDDSDNVLFHGHLDKPRNILSGDEFQLSPGHLHITIG